MTDAYRGFSTRETPQSQSIPGSTQVANKAGGFGWKVDNWERMHRFLILGSEGGTYYTEQQEFTRENAENVIACIKEDGPRAVNLIVEISKAGRAPKNDPAIFALALAQALGDTQTKRLVEANLGEVCRIGTHLFHFAQYVEQFRGWGRALKRSVAGWYEGMDATRLALQVTKYAQRDGWSHRDLLRLAHPKGASENHEVIYDFLTKKEQPLVQREGINLLWASEEVKKFTDAKTVAAFIKEHTLPRELVPNEWLKSPEVWEALLEEMPMTAMIRNLANMTRIGLVAPNSEAALTVANRLKDQERLTRSRVHPIAVLNALMTYKKGQSLRGDNKWTPVPQVIDALDAAFYMAFGNVESTGKRFHLALDVSGSMGWGYIAGLPGLNPREASAAMALVTAATEPNHFFTAFQTELTPLTITPRQRLDDVIKAVDVDVLDFGGTDCSLPMVWSEKKGYEFDAFVVLTDNETWAGRIHPSQALERYRQKTGIPAKLIVVGMTANEVSIADPDDGGMLDVVGFDTATPQLISDFAAGA